MKKFQTESESISPSSNSDTSGTESDDSASRSSTPEQKKHYPTRHHYCSKRVNYACNCALCYTPDYSQTWGIMMEHLHKLRPPTIDEIESYILQMMAEEPFKKDTHVYVLRTQVRALRRRQYMALKTGENAYTDSPSSLFTTWDLSFPSEFDGLDEDEIILDWPVKFLPYQYVCDEEKARREIEEYEEEMMNAKGPVRFNPIEEVLRDRRMWFTKGKKELGFYRGLTYWDVYLGKKE